MQSLGRLQYLPYSSKCIKLNDYINISESAIVNVKSISYDRIYPWGNKLKINNEKYVSDTTSCIQVTLQLNVVNRNEDQFEIKFKTLGKSEQQAESNMKQFLNEDVCQINN